MGRLNLSPMSSMYLTWLFIMSKMCVNQRSSKSLQCSGEQSERNSIAHNAGMIIDNYLFVAYYKAGLRVSDISDLMNIKEVGKYETYRDLNGDGTYFHSIDASYDGE